MKRVIFGNKTFYTLIAILGILLVGGIVYAVSTWTDKPMWHDSPDVRVKIGADYHSLQTAIDNGLLGGGETTSTCTEIATNGQPFGTGVKVDVPAACKFPSTCKLLLQTVTASGNYNSITEYSQDSTGNWASLYNNAQLLKNGDLSTHVILNNYNGNIALYDDLWATTTGEANSNQWTLTSETGWTNHLYLCPNAGASTTASGCTVAYDSQGFAPSDKYDNFDIPSKCQNGICDYVLECNNGAVLYAKSQRAFQSSTGLLSLLDSASQAINGDSSKDVTIVSMTGGPTCYLYDDRTNTGGETVKEKMTVWIANGNSMKVYAC